MNQKYGVKISHCLLSRLLIRENPKKKTVMLEFLKGRYNGLQVGKETISDSFPIIYCPLFFKNPWGIMMNEQNPVKAIVKVSVKEINSDKNK